MNKRKIITILFGIVLLCSLQIPDAGIQTNSFSQSTRALDQNNTQRLHDPVKNSIVSADVEVLRITDDDENDEEHQIDDNMIVWNKADEIYLYNGSSIIRITNNTYIDELPQIDDGQIVWQGNETDDFDVFLYNGTSTVKLSNSTQDDIHPQIDNGQVVWQSWDGVDSEIFFYNGTTIIQLTDDVYEQEYPQIDNGMIVWQGYDGGTDREIYLYNGSSVIKLTNNGYNDAAPQIDDGKVVWTGYDGNDYEIYLYNGSSVIQLSDNSVTDQTAKIDNGQVVWEGGVSNWEIMFYNGTDTIQLTNSPQNDLAPQIDDGLIVWQRERFYGNWDILYYNGTDTVFLTDSDDYWDEHPKIDNGNVAWTRRYLLEEWQDREIMYCYLPPIIGEPLIELDTTLDGIAPCIDDNPYITVDIRYVDSRDAFIMYSSSDGAIWNKTVLTKHAENDTWYTSLPSFEQLTEVLWYVLVSETAELNYTRKNSLGEPFQYMIINRQPTVQLLTPVGGTHYTDEVVITWASNDPDDDILVYTLSYSIDGGAWQEISSGLTETTYTWNTSSMSYSDTVKVRVAASDGYDGVAEDETSSTFIIGTTSTSSTSSGQPDTLLLLTMLGVGVVVLVVIITVVVKKR